MRPVNIIPNIIKNADGSVLYKSGSTEVICTATFEQKIPDWLENSGWITAEYSMIPASTNSRVTREITRGKKNARSQEIQRLIGRSLRGSANLIKMPGISVFIDCDVINADGGTRTASINGGYIALALAFKNKYPNLYNDGILQPVGAISVGKVNGKIVDDLDYKQDSSAEVDLNLVMISDFNLIEIQGTGENGTFSAEELTEMISLGKICLKNIFSEQSKVLK